MDDAAIKELVGAIQKMHGRASEWVEEVRVNERHRGALVWDGSAHRFRLIDHSLARECFAWCSDTDQGGARFLAVLLEPPIKSAANAVRTTILTDSRDSRSSWRLLPGDWDTAQRLSKFSDARRPSRPVLDRPLAPLSEVATRRTCGASQTCA